MATKEECRKRHEELAREIVRQQPGINLSDAMLIVVADELASALARIDELEKHAHCHGPAESCDPGFWP